MGKLSNSVLLASLVAMAAPALALQDEASDAPQALSPERQSSFISWPEDTKAFYSSLSQAQQAVFWALSDEDKVTLSRMEPAQRDDIIRKLEARMNGAAPKGR